MEILSVVLHNFKSHRDQCYSFLPGTNAICGENGAGKTSILEAIAWSLFNYKGAYKVEDLIRNGAASAQVRVSLVSGSDGRTYEVQRCTQRGYQIYDPQVQARLDLSRVEEEVLPWLRQHLGVAPKTDLARLFANTIGVPQGTFTADFLKPPTDRKKIFDTTLKVEEYRQVYTDLASLEKYAKAEVEKLTQAIAQYEEALEDWEPLSGKHQELIQEIAQVEAQHQAGQQHLDQLAQERDQLSQLATQVQQLTTQQDSLQAQISSQEQLVTRLEQEFYRAQQAVEICQTNQAAYQTFLAAEAALRSLEQQRGQQQTLLEQRQAYRDQLGEQQAQSSTLTQQLQQIDSLKSKLTQLQPLVQQQHHLEQQQQDLAQQLQDCQGWRATLSAEQKRLAQVQARLTALESEIAQISGLEPLVAEIPTLEEQQQRYQQHLSRIEAATQFEAELRQLVQHTQAQTQQHRPQVRQAQSILQELQAALPLYTESLQQVQTALETGSTFSQALTASLEEILRDLTQQTAPQTLTQKLGQIQAQLQTARQHQVQVLRQADLITEQQSLRPEIKDLQTNLQQLQAKLAPEADLQAQQAEIAAQLAALEDPRSLQRVYQQELTQQPQLEQQQQALEASEAKTQQAIAAVERQLQPFADLAEQVQTHQHQRDQARGGYQTYLTHQQLAKSAGEAQTEHQQAIAHHQALVAKAETVAKALAQVCQRYNPQQFEAVQVAYKQAETQQITLSARLPEIQKRLQDVERQQQNLQAVQTKRDRAQTDLAERKKIQHFISFSRKAYKQAGPRITERYVQRISQAADRLFRELINRQNVALTWTRDYEIMIQEGAHSRRFVNLSGGEQMCAALAVRLALLKVLADIDIAFFDEPTTNMDRPRREQLAEAIANIKTFRQLFVISHDDTFEKVTGNVVLVERPSD